MFFVKNIILCSFLLWNIVFGLNYVYDYKPKNNCTIMSMDNSTCEEKIVFKRFVDPTFRGNPKTREEMWHRSFKTNSTSFDQETSLVTLLNRIALRYLSSCIPVILYDTHVHNSESIILQKLFQTFPTSYIHGRINSNYTVTRRDLLESKDSKCRSYIVFLADALKTRKVLGAQIRNRVIVVPRSTQWKLQEFLSSPLSRDIVNLLVIGESYSADVTKERPFVLYTHQLYTDGLGSNRPIVLTSWIKGRLSRPHVNLFPLKFSHGFAGHRFIVGAGNQPPYVFKKKTTNAVGNVIIGWDGLEYRILKLMSQILNFTVEIIEPINIETLGSGDAISSMIRRGRADLGIAGMYITNERSENMEMSSSHSTDCAAFITLTSTALPRYRAIMGPFQWPVWVALTFIYLVAIFPLAFSDRLSLRHLIGNAGEVENMFWYVFGTFTNSLTFSGEYSWSSSKKTSTRMLIGWYWVFTIIITACYTGSIIAFVTLPIFPETVDSVDQLLNGYYRVGTFDRGGWEYWFSNSTHKKTIKLLKNLEFVSTIEEGLGNVTKAFFWSYAFLGSKLQFEYIVQANFSDDNFSKRSALHISNECFGLFGVSLAFSPDSVYIDSFNEAISKFQQSGIINKIYSEVAWTMQRSSTGRLLQASNGKLRNIASDERGLTLADTEGMFLLLGIGFMLAGAALFSEFIGGCTNKCREILKRRRGDESSSSLNSASTVRSYRPNSLRKHKPSSNKSYDICENNSSSAADSLKTFSEDSNSRKSSVSLMDNLNRQMMQDLYNGPKRRHTTIALINGRITNESDTAQRLTEQHLEMEKNSSSEKQHHQYSHSSHHHHHRRQDSCYTEEIEVEASVHPVQDIHNRPATPYSPPSNILVDIEENFGEKLND